MASIHSAAKTSCRIVLKFDTELLWLCGYEGKIAWATSGHKKKFKSAVAFMEAPQKGEIALGNIMPAFGRSGPTLSPLREIVGVANWSCGGGGAAEGGTTVNKRHEEEYVEKQTHFRSWLHPPPQPEPVVGSP